MLVLLAGLAVLALLYGLADHSISSRRCEVAALTARTQQAQARAGQLAPYTSFLPMREQRVQAVSQLVESRFDWAYAFQELGRVLRKEASISSLRARSAVGGTPRRGRASARRSTSATPPGSVPMFTLSGCATSQAEVAQTLNRLRLMNGVSECRCRAPTQPARGRRQRRRPPAV